MRWYKELTNVGMGEWWMWWAGNGIHRSPFFLFYCFFSNKGNSCWVVLDIYAMCSSVVCLFLLDPSMLRVGKGLKTRRWTDHPKTRKPAPPDMYSHWIVSDRKLRQPSVTLLNRLRIGLSHLVEWDRVWSPILGVVSEQWRVSREYYANAQYPCKTEQQPWRNIV